MLLGQAAASRHRQLDSVHSLGDAGFSVYSQYGEDGIVEWLCQRLSLSAPQFVEFGVADYKESNTRFLLKNRNWRGLVMDSSGENVDAIHRDEIYWQHNLTAVCAFVTRDNINALLSRSGLSGTIGMLSIDIDGNDYWVWEALNVIDPDIVICEYNAVLGDTHPIVVPYRDDFVRTVAHPSGLYFGASIRALEVLAIKKGYRLLGSTQAGNDAFFVRTGLFGGVESKVNDTQARPSLFRESRGAKGQLTHLGGTQRLEAISHLDVMDVLTGDVIVLGTIDTIYSDAWLEEMGEAIH